MFRENNKKFQVSFFGMVHQLPLGVKKMLDESWAPAFRKLIFDKIDEKRYAVLYSDIASRPNFPVNVWVGLEIIKGLFDYTDEDLMYQWHFNLLTAYALGEEGLGELTLCIRTVYYNRERLLEYEERTGCNLLEKEFKSITDEALKELGVDTKTQRMDTSFVGSFIKKMSRLEIAVKVLQNFYKELPEVEQKRWEPLLAGYLDEEAQRLSFRLKRSEVEAHLKKVGEWLFKLHEDYADDETISGLKSYQHIGRVLREQFQVTQDKEEVTIEIKPAKEISPFSLQNPADDTATFRRKGEEDNQGFVFDVAETCSPANPVQLLTDASLYPNTISDEAIAVQRVPEIKERTGVEEMITDAGFTGEASERVCNTEGVVLIPTEVKGRKLSEDELSLKDFQFAEGRVAICPAGQSPAKEIHHEEKDCWVVRFSREHCGGCPMLDKCPVIERQRFYSLYFNDRQVVVAQRRQKLNQEDYREKCHLRPAVEGTVSQFKRKMHNGKLRVRGIGRVRNVIMAMAIGINFRRIWAYLEEKKRELASSSSFIVILFVTLVAIFTCRWMRKRSMAQILVLESIW